MAGRRSGRVKKHFDYTSFLENDDSDESDDDFVDKSAPPSKKAKSSQEENIKKPKEILTPEKQKNDDSSKKNAKPKRKKIDEKIFEREIKMAMELSMQNTDTEDSPEKKKDSSETKSERKKSSCETKCEINKTSPHKELLYLSRHDIHSPPKSPPVLTSNVSCEIEEQTKNTNKQPVMPTLTPIMNGPSDDIEFLGLADEDEKRRRSRRPSRGSVKKTVEYKAEDSEDDDDSEFEKRQRSRRPSRGSVKKTVEYKPEDSEEDDDEDDSEFEDKESNSDEENDFEEKPKSKKKKQPPPTKSKKENKKQSASTSSTRAQQKIVPKKPVSSPLSSAAAASSSSSSSATAPTQDSTDPIKLVHKSALSKERVNFSLPVNVNSKTVSSSSTSAKISPKIPAWNPPGKSVGNVSNLTSPPNIRRLGLSRNQKVKPLHPTLKVNH